ncbi:MULTISPECIES: M48 family metalloprotease [Niastella]|uniref:M48 family metalloprotease n=1 Tax=Niastella soli TaxID=2821487 RepID=A0ABS3YRX8_9BACT|nr:M48 family metalloprotease [Niastella soli]MBO9200648.1 M48 family metalloprotease [Niastella soli]
MPCFKPLKTVLLALISLPAISQTQSLYNFQDLSHVYYKKLKDSLSKAWECPALYKEKKTQKKYKEIWDDRTGFLTSAIDGNNFIHDGEVYNYIDGIITQLVQANKQSIPEKPLLLIDRSSSVNAYAVGKNVIVVNLGIIAYSQSREELSLVIAHELSHNIMSHPDNAMKQRAEWLTSEEYEKNLNAVLDSKYERLSRLRKVLENYSFSRSKHQRYHESDADSMAIILLKKSNIPFNAQFFLRLDSSDIIYQQHLKTPVKNYFTTYTLSFEDSWTKKRSKGLSTRSYNFTDTSGVEDSLKTHPDCVERYNKTRSLTTSNATYTSIPANIHSKAQKMLIWNMYSNMSLTPCLFRILLEKDKGNTDEWYDFMLYNIITGLYYSDREMHRFNAIGVVQKEYISKDYYELQTLLEQIPREQLEQYCKTLQAAGFWKNMPASEKAMKNLMSTLALDPDNSDKNKARAAKEFTSGNENSMYCEFAQMFSK